MINDMNVAKWRYARRRFSTLVHLVMLVDLLLLLRYPTIKRSISRRLLEPRRTSFLYSFELLVDTELYDSVVLVLLFEKCTALLSISSSSRSVMGMSPILRRRCMLGLCCIIICTASSRSSSSSSSFIVVPLSIDDDGGEEFRFSLLC